MQKNAEPELRGARPDSTILLIQLAN